MTEREAVHALRIALQALLHAPGVINAANNQPQWLVAIAALEATMDVERTPCPVCNARVK
jgi:uncharacterized protein with PIN domain